MGPDDLANRGTSTSRGGLLPLLLLVPAPTIGVLMASWISPGPLGNTVWILCKLWTLALPAIWWLGVEGNRWSWSPARRGAIGIGVALGIAIGVVIVLAYGLAGPQFLSRDSLDNVLDEAGLDEPMPFLMGAVYWTFLNALMEEYVWRWFVFTKCEALLPVRWTRWAIPLSAALFSVHHLVATLRYSDWLGAGVATLGVFIGGTVWAWLYHRYRSIWPPYVSHVIADVAVYAVGWHILFG